MAAFGIEKKHINSEEKEEEREDTGKAVKENEAKDYNDSSCIYGLQNLTLIDLEETGASTSDTNLFDQAVAIDSHHHHHLDLLVQKFPNDADNATNKSSINCFEKQLSLSENLVQDSIQWFEKVDLLKIDHNDFNSDFSELTEEEKQSNWNELKILTNELGRAKTISSDMIIEDIEDDIVSVEKEKDINNESLGSHFHDLPDEIKIKIFSYFSKRELCSYVAPVCLEWFKIAKDPLFWTIIYKTDFEAVDSWLLIEVILSWCRHLSFLELDTRSDIIFEGFEMVFKSCPMIKHLSLKLCRQVDDAVLKLISKYLKLLESIDLEGCVNVTDKSFYNFIGLPLKSFSMAYCNQISDEGGIFLVRNFTNLTKINFDGVQWITEDFVKALVDEHRLTLEEVLLDGENITDKSIQLLTTCKNLRLLNISFCNSLTHKTIDMLSHCCKITDLKLRKGAEFTNQSILSFFNNMSRQQGLNFKSLNLAECTEITDECLHNISERCPNLEKLDLSWCWEVSDGGISFIIDNCHRLKELHLVGLHELYGTPFFRIAKNNPDLRFLDLSQCNKIEDDILNSLLQQLPKLAVINYYGETMLLDGYDGIFESSDSE